VGDGVYVGIDIGGTKTHVLAADGDGVVLDRVLPTHEWQHNGSLQDERSIASLLASFASLPFASEASVVIGAHGLDTAAQVLDFELGLREQHRGPIRAVNDVELLGPAAGFSEAIAVVAGTGSKVVAHATDGSIITAGGYGHLLGDPGSAAALAREGVRAVLDARDRGGESDILAEQLMQHFSVSDIEAAAYAFARNPRLGAWASMAPLVFTAADQGSTLAAAVIEDAASELAQSVAYVVARGAVSADVVCAGGVITNQPRLYDAFTRHIDALGHDLTVHMLKVPPVAGALALARSVGGTRHLSLHHESRRIS
jgi:glucosamine kinase